jgi:hypothetical protein
VGNDFWGAGLTNKSDDQSGPERRPKNRKSVLMTGVVTFAGGERSFDCTFRDLSATGARIAVGKNVQLPQDFYLINIRDRCVYEAKLVRTEGTEVGVTFQKALPLADLSDPKLAYLKRLWMAKATR